MGEESARQTEESVRQTEESVRQTEESARQTEESVRQAEESVRQAEESAKQTEESVHPLMQPEGKKLMGEESAKQTKENAKRTEESVKQTNQPVMEPLKQPIVQPKLNPPANGGNALLRGEKITCKHLERLAIVYIRQSTPQQMIRNQESTQVQYQLRYRALALGWPEDCIEIIDDDLGQSGASAECRRGFQRLVAEVTLDHVGIIFGVEMSRLARSCKDWHQLLEVCALFGALIADLDGIYDPSQYNDRLLLGLKGTMSEKAP